MALLLMPYKHMIVAFLLAVGHRTKQKENQLEKIHNKVIMFFRELYCMNSQQFGLKGIVTDT